MDFDKIGFNITDDPNFLDKQNAITPQLSNKLEKFYELALGGKKSSIPKLLKAIEEHPANPQLKNYLSVLYANIGDYKKMKETNHWLLKEHPNYLFGKLNLANEYFLNKEFDKMPEILGEEMNLQSLFPERETFHVSEVISFFKIATFYFTAIGDLEQAEIRYEIMEELASDHPDTKTAFKHLALARLEAATNRMKEEDKNRILIKTTSINKGTKTTPPKFQNKEIEWLYSNGFGIESDKLNTLLSLPRESLIRDLELVLQDSIERFGYFTKLADNNGFEEEEFSFVIHAIFLLAELKSTDSLHCIFNILSQSEDYIDLYLGDILSSYIWEVVFKLTPGRFEDCKSFMYKPGIYTYSKATISSAIQQHAIYYPETYNEVIIWYQDVIRFFLDSTLDDNVIDSDLIALIVCDIIEINAKDLLPDIKLLFEKGIISIGICGTWDEVSKDITKLNNNYHKCEVLSIAERYEEISYGWDQYDEDIAKSPLFSDFNSEPNIIPVRSEPKIGRNDPCPCGSGKKYKKCCLK